jgi:hypothetical protein
LQLPLSASVSLWVQMPGCSPLLVRPRYLPSPRVSCHASFLSCYFEANVKVNIDDNPENAMQFQVRSTPTFIFFRNGQEVDRIVGAGKKPTYTAKLDALLG